MKCVVSNELREAIFKYYQRKEKTDGVLGIELGKESGTLVFKTITGTVNCTVAEDNDFIYFQMPSGKEDRKADKKTFLEQIGFQQHH